jgi:LPXTG-site transpeptidase (sortase) family protein
MAFANRKINFLENKIIRKFFRPFLILFFINFLIINWNDISWVFNYRVMHSIISNFFQQSEVKAENKQEVDRIENFEYSEKENSIEIAKIGISAPLILVEKTENIDYKKELDKGVVIFPESVLPGQTGQTIVLGHSAPQNWPKIKYDWVFSDLDKLQEKDEVILYYNHQKYKYSVSKKIFLDKDEEIPKDLTNDNNVLILISCWPPGKNFKRIAVETILIN